MYQKIIIFGMGYVGLFLAERLLAEGWDVYGTCRTEEKKRALEKRDFKIALFDGSKPIDDWQNFSHNAHYILNSIPPIEKIDPVYTHHAKHLISLQPKWFGYLSTTGVYGDHQGDWVDENSETRATSARSLARLEAEKSWLTSGLPAHIFRLSGIYGPNRSAIDNLSQGTARNLYKPGHYFSRIHVDDIVQTVIASFHAAPHQIYNLADNEPTPSSDVIEFAAKIMDTPAPPRQDITTTDLSDMAKEFYENNKRVKNDKIKTDLGVTLKYPTYREGLQSILSMTKL